MGVTVMLRLTDLAVEGALEAAAPAVPATVGEVRRNGRFYRHPDSALVSYPVAVDPEGGQGLGKLPEGPPLNIAIVGGGAAGIASLYELSQLARQGRPISVTIYEADPDSFLTNKVKPGFLESISVRGLKAGRVSAARIETKSAVDTIYEVGAMRFPEIAGLTWHYASVAFGDDAEIKIFPNPGKVPTEFVFGNQVDRYVGDDWTDLNSPTRAVRELIIDGLAGSADFFPIGGKAPADVAAELKNSDTSKRRLSKIHRAWQRFVARYDGITLEAAVRRIIRSKAASLPAIPGLSATETENYYVELFGRFGFGTGGFKPLFNMSLVEMMRLILWDYSNEFTLPVTENVEFIDHLYDAALVNGGEDFDVHITLGRVADVCHGVSDAGESASVFFYPHGSGELGAGQYDYVILAAPQDQLISTVTRAGYAPAAREVQFGDDACGMGTLTAKALPPLMLSRQHEAPNARIATAVSQLHMVRSSKVFGTIATDRLKDPEIVPRFKDEPIAAVISDSGLAASYVVPSPSRSNFSTFLVSYTWDDDSTRLQRDYGQYPQNPPTPDGTTTETANAMYQTMVNRASRDVKDPVTNEYKRWWFARLLSEAREDDRFVFDWTTNRTAGGFKLDMTGDYYQSNLCFRYHTHACDTELRNRFFLASDSYSHLGGWLEGAFMSAVNAVAGIIVAENGGKPDLLNAEARDLFALEPVANRCRLRVRRGRARGST
jgi:tryptophan 2-monooxygenase